MPVGGESEPENSDWYEARLHAGINTGNDVADRAMMARQLGAVIAWAYPKYLAEKKQKEKTISQRLRDGVIFCVPFLTILFAFWKNFNPWMRGAVSHLFGVNLP